jgi:hypothetical protein
MFSFLKNIGAYIKVLRAIPSTSVTAAGTGDNAAITGTIIDRLAYGNPDTCVVALPYTTTLAAAATMTFKSVLVEHGDASNLSDAVTFATLETSTGTVIETGGGGGSTNTGCKEYDVDLSGAKRYFRVKATPDLSASGTDTAVISGVVVVGANESLPI